MAKTSLIKPIDRLWIKGASLLLAFTSSSSWAETLSSNVSWSVIGRNVTITEPYFIMENTESFSSNAISVTSGSSVTLGGSYSIQEGDASYCPFCVIQLYTSWIAPAPAGSVGFFSGIISPGFETQFGSILNQELTDQTPVTLFAPKVPGTYFIGLGSTLDFVYQPNVGGAFGTDVSTGITDSAPFQVTVTPIPLSPNPNPTTNTLNTNPSFYYATEGDYTNDGTLINDNANLTHPTGTFSNNGTFTNQGEFSNAGTLNNQGVLNNQADLTNLASGSLNNAADGTLNNSGTLTNQGELVNAGRLNNQGVLDNQANLTNLASGRLNNDADGTLSNSGTLTNQGELGNAGALNNQGTLDNQNSLTNLASGRLNNGVDGTLDNSGTLTNHGELGNAGTLNNQGVLDNQADLTNLASGRLNNDADGTLDNSGTLTNQGELGNAGSLNNQGMLDNQANLTNLAGGRLHNDADGTLNNSGTLTNQGELGNAGTLNNQAVLDNQANLTNLASGRLNNGVDGTLSNSGTLTNQGELGNAGTLNNQAVLDNQNSLTNLASGRLNNAADGTLNNSGTLTNQGEFGNAGVLNNLGNFINQGVLNNSGLITNTGQFNLTATGQLTGTGNFVNTHQGIMNITGAGTQVIEGDIINEGIFKTTDTSVIFIGDFTNNARYESDPSSNQFNNLSIGSNGFLVGGTGDTFIVTGDFNNASSQNALWNTADADLIFSGPISTQHTMGLAGVDQGFTATGAVNNFSWNSMTLDNGNILTLIDGNSTPGAALYTSRIILPEGLSQLNSISSDYNIYFDPTLPGNQYLLGSARFFGSGSGQLLPWNLVPFENDSFIDSGLTPNQQGFAPALNEACSAPTGNLITRCLELQGLSPSQQKQAIASLTPDQTTGQMAGPIKFSATRMDAPFARLASLRGGGGSAPLSFNLNGVQLSASKLGFNAIDGAAGDDDELFRDSPLGVFIQTRFRFGDLQNNTWDRGFSSETRAVTVGADYRINDQLVTGLAFNYTNAATDYVESAGRMNSDTYMGAFYGSYFLPKDFYVDWVANYASNEYSFNRQYGFQGFNGQSNANPEGHQYSFALSSGKDLNWRQWVAGPYLRLEYLNMHIEEYQERGGTGFDMTTGSQTNHSLVSNLGVQISHAVSLNWGVITPSVRVEWEHQYLNDNRSIEMRLSQAAPGLGNFIIQTGEPDRDYINLGGSVSATLPAGGAGFVRYETRLGQTDISDHIVEAGFRMSF